MTIVEIVQRLQSEVATVTFQKADGSERVLNCTLKPNVLPARTEVSSKTENPAIVTAWDVENNGWRCFRLDSVKGEIVF